MNNKIFSFLFFCIVISLHAQENNNAVENLINKSSQFGITPLQKNKIIQAKKNAANKFKAIGRNRNLSGIEKGEKKRQISIELHREINKIITPQQLDAWGRENDYYVYKNNIKVRKKRLEDAYKKDIKNIEKTYSYDKNLMKYNKKKRKERYEREKELLNDLKNLNS